MARKGSWLAAYVEEYSRTESTTENPLYLVAYRVRAKPSRMFYYKLEQLLSAVGGKRIQKSVVMVPERALHLVTELCETYGAEIFHAPFGAKPGSD